MSNVNTPKKESNYWNSFMTILGAWIIFFAFILGLIAIASYFITLGVNELLEVTVTYSGVNYTIIGAFFLVQVLALIHYVIQVALQSNSHRLQNEMFRRIGGE